MIKVTTGDTQGIIDSIREELAEFMTDEFVTVGIHEEAGQHESDDITNASLGAIHEFGADIDHPGGTSYGYASEADANAGRVTFLKTGAGFMELGRTGPHQIKIPARPWLVPGVESGSEEYVEIIEDALSSGKTLSQALEQVGVVAAFKVQEYMTQLNSPPNSPGTINRKGSSNPLIDSGALRQSVTSKVEQDKPSEGIK